MASSFKSVGELKRSRQAWICAMPLANLADEITSGKVDVLQRGGRIAVARERGDGVQLPARSR